MGLIYHLNFTQPVKRSSKQSNDIFLANKTNNLAILKEEKNDKFCLLFNSFNKEYLQK